jgi:hypothetical protein
MTHSVTAFKIAQQNFKLVGVAEHFYILACVVQSLAMSPMAN